MVNKTPPGRLREYLIGDLAVARRHLLRIKEGRLPPTPSILAEISRSIDDCIERIERDLGT